MFIVRTVTRESERGDNNTSVPRDWARFPDTVHSSLLLRPPFDLSRDDRQDTAQPAVATCRGVLPRSPRPFLSSHVLSRAPSSSLVFSRLFTSSHVLPRPSTSSHVPSRRGPYKLIMFWLLFVLTASWWLLSCVFVSFSVLFLFFCYVSFIVSLVKLFVRHAFFPFSCKWAHSL